MFNDIEQHRKGQVKMKTPYVAIAIADASSLTITNVVDPKEADPFEISIPLSELNGDGLDASSMRVGKWILGTVAHWHPEEWARFPNLKFPLTMQPDLDAIVRLISKSVSGGIRTHIASIDALVADVLKADPSAADHPAIVAWPDVRQMLQNKPI